MTILGIDASTKSSGWAVFEDKKLIDYGCVTAASEDLFKRIKKQVSELQEVISKYNITKIILEEVRPENGTQNIKTHKALMYLQGCFAMMLHDNFPKIAIEYLYPSEWRSRCGISTGRGITRASLKPKDIAFVKEKFNITVNDDIADAIGLAYAYLNIKNEKNVEMIEWGD